VQRVSKRRFRARGSVHGSRRGVSDVIGTILILALTVTLFSSIFFFVNTFPKPAAQSSAQFTGHLFYSYQKGVTHNWTNISSVAITHIGGPTLYNFNTQIYVVSQQHPLNTTLVYTLAMGGLPTSWGIGQVWNVSLAADHLTTPDNLTVTVLSGGNLEYRQILPGSNPSIPPIFVQWGTIPGSPSVNSAFQIFVQISDPFLSTSSKKVYLNITTVTTGGLRCGSTTTYLQLNYSSSSGLWILPGCSSASSGTFYVSVSATDSNPIAPLTNSVLFPVTVGTSGSGGGSSLVAVTIMTNTSAPVVKAPLSVLVLVTNNGQINATATLSFGATLGAGTFNRTSASGTVPAGGSVGFPATFTPSTTGAVLLNSTATLLGSSGSATLALTVFPNILLISENVLAGTGPSRTNGSALLASELVSAGIPFTTLFVPCNSQSYPASVTSRFTAGTIAIINFGSNSSSSGCYGPGYNATSPAASITSAFNAGTSFWVVGSRAFAYGAAVANCETTTFQAYLQVFGLAASATTCTVTTGSLSLTSLNPVTYTASSTLLNAGVTAPLGLNGNLTGVSGYATFRSFTPSTTNNKGTSFLTEGSPTSVTIGSFFTGAKANAVAMGTDPSQLGVGPSAGASWGAAGTQVTYNVVNYLAKLASKTAPLRSGSDFGIASSYLTASPPSHTTPVSFLMNLRANDATSGILTVQMLVNGVPATYQGSFVTATAIESGNGANSWVTLTWQAPTSGSYVFSFVLSTSPADGFTLNNQYDYYLTNQAIAFS
jgi:hypothetical protein